jgi:hypothetical protein
MTYQVLYSFTLGQHRDIETLQRFDRAFPGIILLTYIPQVRDFPKCSSISRLSGSSGKSDASPERRRENRLGTTESISRDGQSDLRPLPAVVGWAISAF